VDLSFNQDSFQLPEQPIIKPSVAEQQWAVLLAELPSSFWVSSCLVDS